MLRGAAAKRTCSRLPPGMCFSSRPRSVPSTLGRGSRTDAERLQRAAGIMQAKDLHLLAESLLPVTLAAARVQMAHRAAGVTAIIKADGSPVTDADRESETIILAALARIAPGVPAVSEEAAA